MPLLADPDPTAAFTGYTAAAVSGMLLVLYAVDKVKEKRAEWRAKRTAAQLAEERAKADAAKAHAEVIEADSDAVAAAVQSEITTMRGKARLNSVWEKLYEELNRQIQRVQELRRDDNARLRSIEIQLVQVTSGHQDCERRAAEQATHIAHQDAQIAGLKATCDRQQIELDAHRAALKAAGVSVAKPPPVIDETGEHEPLPPA